MEGNVEDNFLAERLREMLLAMATLLHKLHHMFPAETRPPPGTSPQDHDWVFRLFSVLLVVASLAVLLYYAFFRGSKWGGGAWGATRMLMKPPRSEGPPTLYGHEAFVAAIAMLAFVVLSLGGLYYYYCYQAGCFGGGDYAGMDAPGRKVRMMSR